MNETKNRFSEALTALREKKPLIHCITNYVTAGDTANMLLAAGTSPIMADDPAEVSEIVEYADALVLNMGTLSENRLAAMLKAGTTANKRGIPVVLDPVGFHLSEFRSQAFYKIQSEVKFSVIRGNLSEILEMGGIPAHSHGVDSDNEPNDGLDLTAADEVATRYWCTCAVTGKEDIITFETQAVQLLNGTEKLKRISGAGDMTSAMIAAFLTVTDSYSAAKFGTAFIGICGELAEEASTINGEFKGMGTFKQELFNTAGSAPEVFFERVKIEE